MKSNRISKVFGLRILDLVTVQIIGARVVSLCNVHYVLLYPCCAVLCCALLYPLGVSLEGKTTGCAKINSVGRGMDADGEAEGEEISTAPLASLDPSAVDGDVSGPGVAPMEAVSVALKELEGGAW